MLAAPDSVLSAEVVDTGSLISEGKAPRVALRYVPTVGDSGVYTVRSEGDISVKMGDIEVPTVEIPATLTRFSYQVEDIAQNGSSRTRSKILGVGLDGVVDPDDPVAAAVLQGLSSATRVEFLQTTTPLGVVVHTEHLGEVAGFDAAAVGLMPEEALFYGTILPVETEGVCASWSMETHTAMNGFALQQTSIFEVLEMTDDTITVRMAIEQLPRATEVEPPRLSPEAAVTLASMGSDGPGPATR